MEIAPVPRRRPCTPGRLVVAVLALLLPVTVLTLVPIMLGLDRYVVTGDAMDGVLGRGSVVYTHTVPVSELEVGDVITFTPPGAPTGARVTRRVVALDGDSARTQGDARSAPDPWTLSLDRPSESRVVLALPWLGYPLSGEEPWPLLGLLAAGGLAALAVRSVIGRRRTDGVRGSAPDRTRRPLCSSHGPESACR